MENELDKKIDSLIKETEFRVNWYVQGVGLHGISSKLFISMPTKSIIEIYNIDYIIYNDSK